MKESRFAIQALAGPRQIGKTTLTKQVLDQLEIPSLMVSADNVDPSNAGWISQSWENARARMKLNKNEEFVLAIDEIHKINNWSEAVKKEWDADTLSGINLKVILLGSSRLLLKDGLTESLAGRYELIRMPHWSFLEMNEAFGVSLEEYIYFGGYPGAAKIMKNETRWRNYIKDSIIAPSIEKDVLMTKMVYKPALLKQLFEIGCIYSGKEISYTKLLGQLQDAGNTTTLSNYLNALSEAQLLAGISKYAHDTARKYNSVPKMDVYNNALLSAMSGIGFKKAYTDSSVWGRWVESAVGAHLLNYATLNDMKLYYWRDKDKEVDYILEKSGKVVGIEVKSGASGITPGLLEFKKRFKPFNTYLIGGDGIPVEDFLRVDPSSLF